MGVKKSCCHLFCFGAFDLTFNHNATMTTTVDLLPLFFLQSHCSAAAFLLNQVLRHLETSLLRPLHPRHEVLSKATNPANATRATNSNSCDASGGVKRGADGAPVSSSPSLSSAVYITFPTDTHPSFVHRCRLEVSTGCVVVASAISSFALCSALTPASPFSLASHVACCCRRRHFCNCCRDISSFFSF